MFLSNWHQSPSFFAQIWPLSSIKMSCSSAIMPWTGRDFKLSHFNNQARNLKKMTEFRELPFQSSIYHQHESPPSSCKVPAAFPFLPHSVCFWTSPASLSISTCLVLSPSSLLLSLQSTQSSLFPSHAHPPQHQSQLSANVTVQCLCQPPAPFLLPIAAAWHLSQGLICREIQAEWDVIPGG